MSRDDGLELRGAYVTAAVRCAPPANKPKPGERDNCREYLERELDVLSGVRVVLTLGGYAYTHALRVMDERGHVVPTPRPKFAHGRVVRLGGAAPRLIASYHPSQQNTFTGKLTPEMLDRVLSRARQLAGERRGAG